MRFYNFPTVNDLSRVNEITSSVSGALRAGGDILSLGAGLLYTAADAVDSFGDIGYLDADDSITCD